MLVDIVKKYGGDLFQNGTRALIPAPGHSAADRSVSVFLTAEGKVRVHCFTDVKWSDVLRTFREDNLILTDGKLSRGGSSGGYAPPVLTDSGRTATAAHIWSQAVSMRGSLSHVHLTKWRRIKRDVDTPSLGHHPSMPLSVYSSFDQGRHHPALLAKITDQTGKFVGIEAQYLQPNGARTTRLRFNRKTVGHLLPYAGIAVRIDKAAPEMVVGEGIASALSASDEYDLPCWALLSSNNYDNFVPPSGLKELVIAAERDRVTLKKIEALQARLEGQGIRVRPEFVPLPYSDINEYRGGRAA